MKKIITGEAPSPDGVCIEMLNALEDFGIEKLTEIANKIYDSGVIPEYLSRSIFIA